MPTFGTEGTHAGEFIVSEANGSRSREAGTLASGHNLAAGAVVGMIAGEYVEYNNGNVDGSETAVGVLFDAVDASAAAADCVVIARDAEVNLAELVWEAGQDQAAQDAAVVELAAVGIIAR